MKKITLVLCACAIAFAGLLVSCNNATGDYIQANTVNYSYNYNVSGTITEVDSNGAVASPTVTTTSWTITKAVGGLNWTENTQEVGDQPRYNFWVNATATKSVTVGSGDPTKTYYVSKSLPGRVQTLYKFEDDLYIKLEDGKYSKVTIDEGSVGDDEFTLSYEYTWDNGSTETTVRTTKYSAKLTFKTPEADAE